MSWSDRRSFLALAAAGLTAGCFRPMLAAGSPAESLQGHVVLPPVGDRMSYFLHQSLRDRLGDTETPSYRLEVALRRETAGLGVSSDNSITRINVRVFADYALFGRAAPEPILTGTVSSESAYSSTSSLYATRQTQEDIDRRLAVDLGERVARRLFAAAERGEIP